MARKGDKLPSLDALQEKIDAAVQKDAPTEENGPPAAVGLSVAMRMGMELVAGVGVGAVAGYFLDEWAGTMPLFLIIGFLAGCAAGFLNMKRAVEQLDKAEESGTTPRA